MCSPHLLKYENPPLTKKIIYPYVLIIMLLGSVNWGNTKWKNYEHFKKISVNVQDIFSQSIFAEFLK